MPKEKGRRKAGFAVGGAGIVAVGALALYFFNPFGWDGFGWNNNGEGDSKGNGAESSIVSDSGTQVESKLVTIKIDEEKIYFDDVLCADENELKAKITDVGTNKEYELVHTNAIKATYDKVKAVLTDLESALSIKVNYNE